MEVPSALPLLMAALVLCSGPAALSETKDALLKVGGFRCVDLKPLKNDSTYDLYETGYFCYASFRMDIWKRHGVPFLYQKEAGNIRVAGPGWKPDLPPAVSGDFAGAVARADAQAPGNGAISNANDGALTTYWYAGDYHPAGKLWIEFAHPAKVHTVRFIGWATPRHAPKDYSIGLILPDGKKQEIAAVHDEKRMGEWISFRVDNVMAAGVYIDVKTTMEAEHGPVVYELQALGEMEPQKTSLPSEVAIPLGGTPAEELFCLGHVGEGFEPGERVGEYVVNYADGGQEAVPLVAGKNLARYQHGDFVPEAEFAFGFKDKLALPAGQNGALCYHLDEMLPVEPRRQLMMFSHKLAHPGAPMESLTFRCTSPKAALVLAGLTLRQSGPRMNALVYNGKQVKPYPKDTPKAKPSPIEAMVDKSRVISLDGQWQYITDPGNLGARAEYFKPDYDASRWKTMPAPSQWYVEGLDYHGVVWFRREFEVPRAFPGEVLELRFGGVDYDARVWVNGEYAGRHTGAFSSFRLDATKAVKKGAKNLIVVRVDSPIDPGYSSAKTIIKGNSQDDIAMPYNEEGCSGGIFRSVALIGHGDVGIKDVWTVTSLSEDLKRAEVTVRCDLSTALDDSGKLDLRVRLTEPGRRGTKPRVFEQSSVITVGRWGTFGLGFSIENPLLWYPWEQGTPHLHTLEVEVWRGKELLDRHVSRVGVREVTFNDKEHCVYVNHHRIFIKGMLNDDIHWMSMMDRTGYRQRIQLQKDANLNLIRMVGHQSSPDMYDLCDEMGMMIWQEMPLQWGYSSAEPIRSDILSVVDDTVRQCRPHASVVGWSAWNEGGQAGFSEQITNAIKTLDGTRPMTQACGGGDFDIHIYPNITPAQMSRRTFFWTGLHLGFVSEVGAYGLSSLDEMKEMCGEEMFPFDSADYYWETFNSYRWNDGPVFWDSPSGADWSTERIRDYVMEKIGPSERWLCQFMKFMYEDFHAQIFDPTTAAIHCRFDDALPTAYLGVVNFNGRPRKAYWSVREALQQVAPIIYFGFSGVEDVRVVNEYWFKGWTGCRLKYRLTDRAGKLLIKREKRFDLPADSVVKVLTPEEAGDVFHIPGGFLAELTVADSKGRVLSKNHYDLTEEEIQAFVTSVYPTPPVEPIDSVIVISSEITATTGAVKRSDSEGTYSPTLLQLGGNSEAFGLVHEVAVPLDGEYLVRIACDSGTNLRSCELLVDGKKAELESYPYTSMELGMTRQPYSTRHLSWHPGWRAHLTKGSHRLEIKGKGSLTIDAICLQSADNKNLR